MYHPIAKNLMAKDLNTGLINSLNGRLAAGEDDYEVIVNNAIFIGKDIEVNTSEIHLLNVYNYLKILVPIQKKYT